MGTCGLELKQKKGCIVQLTLYIYLNIEQNKWINAEKGQIIQAHNGKTIMNLKYKFNRFFGDYITSK